VCRALYFGKWVDNIAYAEFAYNNSYQSTIRMAPFVALYGRKWKNGFVDLKAFTFW
jgi:hypothetical protein